jgi:hypothetical protein
MTDERIVFQMEIEAQADPITGVLRSEERELPFAGWVGLAGALESFMEHNQTQEDRKDESP